MIVGDCVKKRILVVLTIVVFLYTITVFAEVIEVKGYGIYYMNETESLDKAKNIAKLYAIRSAAESISTKIIAETYTENSKLKKDEIIAVTAGVIKVHNTTYQLNVLHDDTIEVRATVYVEADINEIDSAIKEEIERRKIEG